jgi:hypothetical protein
MPVEDGSTFVTQIKRIAFVLAVPVKVRRGLDPVQDVVTAGGAYNDIEFIAVLRIRNECALDAAVDLKLLSVKQFVQVANTSLKGLDLRAGIIGFKTMFLCKPSSQRLNAPHGGLA